MRQVILAAMCIWAMNPASASASLGIPTDVTSQTSAAFENAMRQEMAQLSRFEILQASGTQLADHIRYAAARARQISASQNAYVLNLSHRIGALRRSDPRFRTSTDKKTGVTTTTMTVALETDIVATCEVIDAITGQSIRRIQSSVELSKSFDTFYTSKFSQQDVARQISQLHQRVDAEARAPIQSLFAGTYNSKWSTLAQHCMWELRKAPPFQLRAPITAHHRFGDLLTFDLGSISQIRMDDTFMIMRKDRALGYARVHGLESGRSAAQVIALEEPLASGDEVAEYPKGTAGMDLTLGTVGLAHPDRTQWYGTATLAGQFDLAPVLSFPELHLGADMSFLYSPQEGAGLMGFMGLNQKIFLRQLVFVPGARVGMVYAANPARAFQIRPLVSADLGIDFQASPQFAWHNAIQIMVDPAQFGGQDILLNVGFQTGFRFM